MSQAVETLALGPVAIARLCHVAPETVYRWIEDGKLPAFRTAGGHRRVWPHDVDALMKKLKLQPPLRPKVDRTFTVLVVDDEDSVRRMVGRVIRALWPHAVVVEAADGFEAGRHLVASAPRVIVLDLMLPGVDGYNICRVIRKDPQLADVKILAISGSGEAARQRILEAGANNYLAKPFEPRELQGVLSAFTPSGETV